MEYHKNGENRVAYSSNSGNSMRLNIIVVSSKHGSFLNLLAQPDSNVQLRINEEKI